MKILFVCILLGAIGWADLPDRVWLMPGARYIQTTETVAVSDDHPGAPVLSEVPADKNLDDIPLAKTFPIDSEEGDHLTSPPVASKQHAVDTAPKEKLHALMEKELSKKRAPSQKQDRQTNKSSSGGAEAVRETAPVPSASGSPLPSPLYTGLISFIRWVQAYAFVPILFLLFLGLVMSMRQRFRSMRKDSPRFRSQREADEGDDSEWETFARLLESFSSLKGEVRQRFLQRKQNILFNDDFTQYQKAKALLELEREYTQIEFIELPKLFSTDIRHFTEAERKLSAYPELRDLIYDFIESPMHQRQFTKSEKEQLRENMPGAFPSAHHTWDYDARKERHDEKEQTAYLLQ